MSLIIYFCKSLTFDDFLQSNNLQFMAEQLLYSYSALEVIALCLLIGAMGKSAQIFFHPWLPDAMEGPTPVSALIHAATMVTAGVFLIARSSFLFEMTPRILDLIVLIGLATSIFAATIALVQTDIKKVIAYSTCSQLGYMFFASGLSGYPQALFHLFTHAFFKALLFLGAGSIIHGLGGEQDLRKMGGLKQSLPITYFLFLIGSLAIAGIFPFAGFFSKDAILELAKNKGTPVGDLAYWGGLAVAFLTALYSWRLLILAFDGKKSYKEAPHESGLAMLLPLALLSLGAIFSGYLGEDLTHANFWKGALLVQEAIEIQEVAWYEAYLPMIVAVAGIIISYPLYHPALGWGKYFRIKPLQSLLFHGYFFDCFYYYVFCVPIKLMGVFCYKIGDKLFLGGLVKQTILFFQSLNSLVRNSGNLQYYLLFILAFLTLFICYWNFIDSNLYPALGFLQEDLLSLGILVTISYFLLYKVLKL
jgi:NADH-quinone oxidoreductase subunit L